MLMSRFPLSLTSILSPLPPQLLLMLLPLLLMLMPMVLTLLPLLLMLLPQLLSVMPAMPELLPLLILDTPELMLLPPLPTDMPELLPLLPTDMLLTNLRMLSTACYFYRDRLYKVHLSEWSSTKLQRLKVTTKKSSE